MKKKFASVVRAAFSVLPALVAWGLYVIVDAKGHVPGWMFVPIILIVVLATYGWVELLNKYDTWSTAFDEKCQRIDEMANQKFNDTSANS